MPEQIQIPVQDIAPNPYQTRFDENAERIASIALSIAQDGLLQPPTVRNAAAHPARPSIPDNAMWYELAFGHTRTAAWKLCNEIQLGKVGADESSAELFEAVRNSTQDFSKMPVFIADIDDEKMFRHAVTENAQRADLSPVEEATAMKKAMEEFAYTSEQAGALFGTSGATVRGKVRLLDLPKAVQTKLHDGSLSEGAARMMLVLSRMAPDRVDDALEDILEGEDPENLGDEILRLHKEVKRISEENFPITAKTFKHLPELNEKEPAVDEEKKAHLLTPPACTACPFHAKVVGDDYCSFLACFERKQESQATTNLEAASKKTGIAIYSKEADGECFVLDRWEDTHRKAVEKKDANVRLMKAHKIQSYWHYIHNDIPMSVALVAVGALAERFKKAKIQSDLDRGRTPEEADPKQKARAIKEQVNVRVVRNEYDRIMFETIAPFFLPMLETVKSEGLLELLADSLGVENELFDARNESRTTGKARLKHLHLAIICELWERESESYEVCEKSFSAKLPVTELAKGIRARTEKWGVKLGKEFDQAASDADARINAIRLAAVEEALKNAGVSAETTKART